MNVMKRMTQHFMMTFFFFALGLSNLFGQILLKEITLQKQIENSTLVVEGKVVSKKSFWDADNKNIYTANTVEVYKVFKGELVSLIEIITPGGTFGNQAQIISPSLKLREGDLGVFTLYNSNIPIATKNKSTKKQFITYSSLQGFYKYNIIENQAINVFSKKEGIATSFYNEIMNLTKLNYMEVNSFDVVQSVYIKSTLNKATLAPTAISFSPTTITAGTKSTITITIPGGATGDFGALKGKVAFYDADLGGNGIYIDALASQITSWSPNSITVQVPSSAGTGKIRVTNNDATFRISTTDLTVTYSIINYEFGGNAYIPQHYNRNTLQGGYVWQMYTGFDANSNAKNSFMRAFNNWICNTGIDWKIGVPTTVNESAIDNVNVIRFDNSLNPLAEGVLGQCSYVFETCDNVQWLVAEMDIEFNDDLNDPGTPGNEAWNFSTNLPNINEYDFESVALHELGHGRMLGHVINSSEVMHYSISNAEASRVLSPEDIAAGLFVQDRSVNTSLCGTLSMINASCPLSIGEEELKAAINIYPNPTRGELNIKNNSLLNLEKVVIYDIRGRQISEYDMTNSARVKTINLFNVSKGMYFVNIYSDKAMITKKIILE